MKNIYSLFFLLTLALLGACNKSEDSSPTLNPVTDQQIPGTNIDLSAAVKGVYNISICPNGATNPGYTCPAESANSEGKVTLTWEIPTLHRTEEWFVVIYRAPQAGNETLQMTLSTESKTNRSFPAPANSIFEVKRIKDNTWTDDTVVQGAKYYYWISLVLEGEVDKASSTEGYWSTADKKPVEYNGNSAGAQFPTPEKFWLSYGIGGTVKWSDLVYAPSNLNGVPFNTYRSMKAGAPAVGKPKGRIAVANGGAVLFSADTDNNRVLVFENKTALTCVDSFPNDPLSLYACMLQAEGQPPYPINILGQPDDSTNLSCQQHNDVCGSYTSYCQNITSACAAATTQDKCDPAANSSTVPPKVAGQLDSRICFWSAANNKCEPLATSCSNESKCAAPHLLSGTTEATPSFCKWTANTCKVKGSDCLTQPTEILVTDKSEVLISDSGNHRVLYYDNSRFSLQAGGTTLKYTLGCDSGISAVQTTPTKCTPDKLIGKPNFDDLSLYPVESLGASALNYPTGLAVQTDDLYIADTNNNRVVKVYSFRSPNQYLCNDDTWGTALCQFKGLLGQADYLSGYSFKDYFNRDNTLLGGTFSNELQVGITSPSKPNNLPYWVGKSEDILRRYFRNPTKIKFVTRDSKTYMLLLSNEDFNATTGIGVQVSMRSRILRYDTNPLDGASPKCNDSNFATSEDCMATEVIGQENFKKMIILSGTSGGTGSYSGSVFALDSIDDMDVLGTARIIALSGTSNEIYSWNDFLNKEALGFPYNQKIVNPQGALSSTGAALPNLQGLGGIIYDVDNAKCYVVDAKGSKAWQLDFFPSDY